MKNPVMLQRVTAKNIGKVKFKHTVRTLLNTDTKNVTNSFLCTVRPQ